MYRALNRVLGPSCRLTFQPPCWFQATREPKNLSSVVLFFEDIISEACPRRDAHISLLRTILEDHRQKTRLPIWERIWERNQYLNALYVPLRSQNAC
jgi:hypothetical protein